MQDPASLPGQDQKTVLLSFGANGPLLDKLFLPCSDGVASDTDIVDRYFKIVTLRTLRTVLKVFVQFCIQRSAGLPLALAR